jgi:hypothetical protein
MAGGGRRERSRPRRRPWTPLPARQAMVMAVVMAVVVMVIAVAVAVGRAGRRRCSRDHLGQVP